MESKIYGITSTGAEIRENPESIAAMNDGEISFFIDRLKSAASLSPAGKRMLQAANEGARWAPAARHGITRADLTAYAKIAGIEAEAPALVQKIWTAAAADGEFSRLLEAETKALMADPQIKKAASAAWERHTARLGKPPVILSDAHKAALADEKGGPDDR
jgi:hypothetical protein